MALKLTFSGKVSYARNDGFRTAETTLPFKMLAGISMDEKGLVVDAVSGE